MDTQSPTTSQTPLKPQKAPNSELSIMKIRKSVIDCRAQANPAHNHVQASSCRTTVGCLNFDLYSKGRKVTFSHTALALILALYHIGGMFLFFAIEGPYERQVRYFSPFLIKIEQLIFDK